MRSRRCGGVNGAERLKPQDSLGSKTEHGRVTVDEDWPIAIQPGDLGPIRDCGCDATSSLF